MRRWTEEERQRQAERIRQWRPWERSTGPTTAEGKVIASRNADKGGTRPMLRELCRALRENQRALEDLSGGT